MLGMLSSDNEKEQGQATGFVRKSTDFIGFCTELAKETFYQIGRANVRVQRGIKLIVCKGTLDAPFEGVNGLRFDGLPFGGEGLQKLLSLVIGFSVIDGIGI